MDDRWLTKYELAENIDKCLKKIHFISRIKYEKALCKMDTASLPKTNIKKAFTVMFGTSK